jgi:hypothetical protein
MGSNVRKVCTSSAECTTSGYTVCKPRSGHPGYSTCEAP